MLETTKTFEKDNTIYFEVSYRKATGVLTDPVTPTYIIKDSIGASITNGTPTKKSTGKWFFYYTPTSTGDFTVEFTGTIENYATFIKRKFKVVDVEI
jgi:hypothetical protein